jgi:hypothetical protein
MISHSEASSKIKVGTVDTKPTFAYALSVTIAILAIIASVGGLFISDLYRDNTFVTTVFRSNDLVTLVFRYTRRKM